MTVLRSLSLVPVMVLLAVAPARAQSGAVPVTTAEAERQDVAVVQRAIGTVQAFQSVTGAGAGGRHAGQGAVHRRAAGQARRPAGAARSAALPGRAGPGDRQEGGRRGDAGQRPVRPGALRRPRQQPGRVAPEARADAGRRRCRREANVRGDDAQIAAAQLNLDFTRITSPIEGRVGLRLVDPGNFIRVGGHQHAPGIVDHRPDPADRADVHPAAGRAAARCRRPCAAASCR